MDTAALLEHSIVVRRFHQLRGRMSVRAPKGFNGGRLIVDVDLGNTFQERKQSLQWRAPQNPEDALKVSHLAAADPHLVTQPQRHSPSCVLSSVES